MDQRHAQPASSDIFDGPVLPDEPGRHQLAPHTLVAAHQRIGMVASNYRVGTDGNGEWLDAGV